MSLPALADQAHTPRYDIRGAAVAAIKPRSCLAVYLALVDRLGANTTVWPTVATIMQDTGCAERSVRRALRTLEATGWLVRVPSDRRATEYRVCVGVPVAELVSTSKGPAVAPEGANHDPLEADVVGGPSVAGRGASGDPQGGHRWPVGGPAVTPEPCKEPYKELENNNTGERAHTREAPPHEAPSQQLTPRVAPTQVLTTSQPHQARQERQKGPHSAPQRQSPTSSPSRASEAPHAPTSATSPKETPVSYLDLFPELEDEDPPARGQVVSLRSVPKPEPTKVRPSELPKTRSGHPNLAMVGGGHIQPEPKVEEPFLLYDGEDGYPVDDALNPGDVVMLPPTLAMLFECAIGGGVGWIARLRAKGVETTEDLFTCVDTENMRFTLGGALGEAVATFLAVRWGAPLLSKDLREAAKAKRETNALLARQAAKDEAKREAEELRAREDAAGVVRLGEVRHAR